MKKEIGQWFLGNENIRVVIDTKSRYGHAQLPGNWKAAGRILTGVITVGLAIDWGETVETLLHEAFEYASVKHGCRFVGDARYNLSPSHGIFCITHDQYSEIMAHVGFFASNVLPELAAAHKKYHK